jgi:hypothetical protein
MLSGCIPQTRTDTHTKRTQSAHKVHTKKHVQAGDMLTYVARDALPVKEKRKSKNPLQLKHMLRYNHKNLVSSGIKIFRMMVSWERGCCLFTSFR